MLKCFKIFFIHHPFWTLLFLTALVFAPFSNKAFHLDSNVTVYVAHQMTVNFLNPPLGDYGKLLSVWNNTELPRTSAYYATPHPPLIPAYLVAFVKAFGENECVLNWAMFPFFVISVLFFFGIAKRVVPLWHFHATLLFMVCPVVVVNAQNIMLDVPLMAFTLGAFYFMFRSSKPHYALFAGIMAACACLTKSTGGTIVISGLLYYCFGKKWKNCVWFFIPILVGNGLWAFHNIIYFGKIELIANGSMHYVWGDFRYRLERLLSQLGGTIVFPLIPLILFLGIKRYRPIAIIVLASSSLWSMLLMGFLHYSAPSAAFYAISAASGALLMYGIFKSGICFDSKQRNVSFSAQLLLQLIGGLFLGSYESRYMLPFVFIAVLFFVQLINQFPFALSKKIIWWGSISISFMTMVFLSIADYQYVDADRRCAPDIQKNFPHQKTYFFGRLGYLYYMNKAGFQSLSISKNTFNKGDLIVRNCISRDDSAFFEPQSNFVLVKEFRYPMIGLRTIGGRSGFYGCDRLPFAWNTDPIGREFKVYTFIGPSN